MSGKSFVDNRTKHPAGVNLEGRLADTKEENDSSEAVVKCLGMILKHKLLSKDYFEHIEERMHRQ